MLSLQSMFSYCSALERGDSTDSSAVFGTKESEKPIQGERKTGLKTASQVGCRYTYTVLIVTDSRDYNEKLIDIASETYSDGIDA